jgi:hypothetical protein
LNSPPPLISLHQQKKTPTRRAFARDLNPPPVIPVLHGGPYAMGPPRDAPGWDCSPAPPMPWAEWAGERGMDVDIDAAVLFVSSSSFFWGGGVPRADCGIFTFDFRIYRMI